MTLILTAVSSNFILMASDRRLTIGKEILNEESGKAGFIQSNDGIAIYAYTGLAVLNDFKAKQWIQEALLQSSAPSMKEILYNFSDAATKKLVGNLAYYGEGITLVVAGYIHGTSHFMGVITNLEDEYGSPLAKPAKQFQVNIQSSTAEKMFTGVMVNGINQTKYLKKINEISELVIANKPAIAIEQKAVETIRIIADHEVSAGTVGKQVTVASLQAPTSERFYPPRAAYHSEGETDRIYLLDVTDLRTGTGITVRDVELVFDEPMGPKLGRNARCWCKSGAKFKDCHGR